MNNQNLNPLRWLALLAALVICACGHQGDDDRELVAELGELRQAIGGSVHVPYGPNSRAYGFTEVAGSPHNGSCSGPLVGGYTCWIPYPSWLVWDVNNGGNGSTEYNNWRYVDPTSFNTIAQSFNSWLGFSAGTNGLADAWAAITSKLEWITMSYENVDGGDDTYLTYGMLDQNLAGVAATNQTLNIQAAIKYDCLEDGGTLTDFGHPATWRYCRLGQWYVDTGTLGAWIGANCTTTTCKRNAVKKIFTIMFAVFNGAPKSGTISNTDILSPWISVGGPPTSMTFPSNTECLLDSFSFGVDQSTMWELTQFEICP